MGSTGDNFYPSGVTSINDRRFSVSWSRVYETGSLRGKTWYQSIGNHDHYSETEMVQRDYHYRVNRKWYFPDLYYSFTRSGNGVDIDFFVLDSQSLRKGKHNPARQKSWFESALSRSTAYWKVVIVHHPPYSAGNYGTGSSTIRNDAVRYMERNKADVDYVLSGGGGGGGLYSQSSSATSELRSRYNKRVEHFTRNFGFVGVDANSSRMKFEFIDRTNSVRYTYRRYDNDRRSNQNSTIVE